MRIAILGLGTVGSGVIKVLQDNAEVIEERIGQPIEVSHIFANRIHNSHGADLSQITVTDVLDVIEAAQVDLVVEVMGGIDFCYQVHKRFLSQGIHVVSANKDMLAVHLEELAALGNENQAQLSYEASCAGGIPIINTLIHGLNANRLTRMMGILNGTTNYILTKMSQDGWDFDRALKEAQALGFAEADPTNDVEGFDAQRKIAILSRLAYGSRIDLKDVAVRGISDLEVKDIKYGQEAGLTLKLLGQSEFNGDHLTISVEPSFLPNDHQLASVNGASNAVFVNGNAVGEAMFYGPGAGSMETASAVVSDIMNIAKYGFVGNFTPSHDLPIQAVSDHAAYYLRFDQDPRQALEEAGLSYRLLASGPEFVLITEEIAPDRLEKLDKTLSPQAIYRVIGQVD